MAQRDATIKVDASAIPAVAKLIRQAVALDEPHDLCIWDKLQALGLKGKAFAAVRTGELQYRLEPSDELLNFLAAFRAGNGERLVGGHGGPRFDDGASS